ncbi:MAG TPA: anaerobic ribonucleoside-triphosphate reductase activating protein, partial [Spirochaetaceae bacterium]|nr:anaerobic ribonucleoside-triphosphate reductase activating protein [Spirochaetaceae bacterium]
LWLKGCNLACPYCHNPLLVGDVLRQGEGSIGEDEFFDFVSKRKNFLEGIVISGGEATLYEELPSFLKRVRECTDLKIKLDTNLTNPLMLGCILEEKLADYVAADVKAPLDNYSAFASTNSILLEISEKIRESLSVLDSYQIEFELRTTCVKNLLSIEDFYQMKHDIITCIPNRRITWYLQQFRNSVTLLPAFKTAKGYSYEELEHLTGILSNDRVSVFVR